MALTSSPRPVRDPIPDGSVDRSRLVPVVLGAALVLAVLGWLLPDRTVGPGMTGDTMTHYMALLGVNQPWNLLLFMAIPVILAETLAITELVLLLRPTAPTWVRSVSRAAGLIAGPVMLLILVHLVKNAVFPLTSSGGWRGSADVVAVLAYLAGAVPMMAITLVELGLLGRTAQAAQTWHTAMVAVFLVVAHVAMIFGMLDPGVLGWSPVHAMPGGGTMPGMSHH